MQQLETLESVSEGDLHPPPEVQCPISAKSSAQLHSTEGSYLRLQTPHTWEEGVILPFCFLCMNSIASRKILEVRKAVQYFWDISSERHPGISKFCSLFKIYLLKTFLKIHEWKHNLVAWINVDKEGSSLNGEQPRFFLSAPISGTKKLWTLNTICSFQGSQICSTWGELLTWMLHLVDIRPVEPQPLKTTASKPTWSSPMCVCHPATLLLCCCSLQPLPPPAHRALLEGRERCQCLRGQPLEQLSHRGSLLTFPF